MVNKSAINRLRDVVLFLNQLLSFAPFTNEAINTVSDEVIPHLLKVIDSIDLADITLIVTPNILSNILVMLLEF
jgi:hypothetical protein